MLHWLRQLRPPAAWLNYQSVQVTKDEPLVKITVSFSITIPRIQARILLNLLRQGAEERQLLANLWLRCTRKPEPTLVHQLEQLDK